MTSSDGLALAGLHLPGTTAGRLDGTADGLGTALAVCHGFTHHTRHRSTRGVLGSLAEHSPVVALDMRGHGRSSGRSSVGDRESLDLDAAVTWARAAGYDRVATVGFSLGAAVALCHAASRHAVAARPDAVVAVSSPARWYSRETPPMRRVRWLLEQPHGGAVARMLGVRLGQPWDVVPPSPVEAVAAVAPVPLLLVHFAGDRYFSAAHAQALLTASGGHAELWTEPGTGHGESGTDPDLAARIARWARAAAGTAGPVVDTVGDRSTVGPLSPAPRRASRSEDR